MRRARVGFLATILAAAFAAGPVFAADTTPPSTPSVTDDGAYTTSTTQLHATWTSSDPESGITQYQYQIRQDSTSGTILVNFTSTGTTTSVTRTGLSLVSGKTYYFSVKSKNGAGLFSAVGNSNGIKVDTSAPGTPGTPTEGGATDQDFDADGSYAIVWTAASDAESGISAYQLQEKLGTAGTWTTLTSSNTSRSVSVSGRINGNTYFYQVRAKNGAGIWGAYSATSDGITIDTSAPSAVTVTDDGATTSSTTQLHATWTASSDAQSGIAGYDYQIRRDSATGTIVRDWTSAGTATQVTATGLTLTNGVTYFIGVRARNGAGATSTAAFSDGIKVQTTTDTTPPTGTVAINGGAASTTSPNVTLTLSATDDSGTVSQMRFSNDGITYSAAQAYAATAAWTLTSGDGTKTVYAQFSDPSGNWSSAATDTIQLTSASTGGAFQESGGQVVMEAEHFSRKTALGGKDWMVESSRTGFSGTGYTTALPNTGINVNSGYVGTVAELIFDVDFVTTGTYYVWLRGFGGTTSDDSVHAGIDGTGPSSADRIGSFPAAWTWSRSTLDAVSATLGVTTSGRHTIHLWMREDGFSVDKILLRTNSSSTAPTGTGPAESPRASTDATPPTGTVTINGGAAYTTSASVTLTLSATDDSGTVSQMQCSNDNVTYSAAEAYAISKTWTLTAGDGAKTVYAKFKDAAGNWSAPASDAITLDTVPPSAVTVTDDGATTASTTQLHATWTASSDATSGLARYDYQIRQDSASGLIVRDWTSNGTATDVTATGLSLTVGTSYFLGVRAVDNADLASAPAFSDGITVQSAGGGTTVNANIMTDTTWTLAGSPYRVTVRIVIGNNATLTIQPGVEVRFDASTALIVGELQSGGVRVPGYLKAPGTSAQPITFTSGIASPAPGSWEGFSMSVTSPATSLDFCVVEYAITAFDIRDSDPAIRHCTIRRNSSVGVLILNGNPILEHNTITANPTGIRTVQTPILDRIRHNTIAGNTTGFQGDDFNNGQSVPLNWWGQATGPSGVGPGTGDPVTGSTLIEPWLAQPPTEPLKWLTARADPTTFSPVTGLTHISATLSQAANWTIAIHDAANATVRTFTGTGAAIEQDWDGTDASGSALPDGAYRFELGASDAGSGQTAAIAVGRMTLTSGLPVAFISSPTQSQTVQAGALQIRGTAAGGNFSSYTAQYALGSAPPGQYQFIGSGSSSVTNGLLATWTIPADFNTPYVTLRLLVFNPSGQSAAATTIIRIVNVYTMTANKPAFSPNGDFINDTTRLTFSATVPLDWTLDLLSPSSNVVKSFTGSSSTTNVFWDGTTSGGPIAPDGIYTMRLRGTDPVSGQITTGPAVPVTLDTVFPTAVLSSPTEGAVIKDGDLLPLVGQANDLNFTRYVVSYARSSDPLQAVLISPTPVANGTLHTIDLQVLPPDVYRFELSVEDAADNRTIVTRQVTLDHITFTNVSAAPMFIEPYLGEQATVAFTLSRPADVTARFYQDVTKQLVRTISLPARPAGANTVAWNGRTDANAIAPLEAYYVVLSASDAQGRSGAYTRAQAPFLGAAPTVNNNINPDSQAFDPHKNDVLDVVIQLSAPGRESVRVIAGITPTSPLIMPLWSRPLAGQEVHHAIWDGHLPSGAIYAGDRSVYAPVPDALPMNAIVLQRPAIEFQNFRAQAYLIQPGYGEVSTLTYTLSRDANVSIRLTDPNGNATRTLLTNASQTAGPQTIEWNGRADDGRVVSLEGDYTVTLEATDPLSGLTDQRFGNVVVYK